MRKKKDDARKLRRLEYLAATLGIVASMPREETAGKLFVTVFAHEDYCPMAHGEHECVCEPDVALMKV